MNRLKDLWGGQDAINRVAFIAAIAAFAWCIVQGHGMYGVVFAVVILFLIISRQNQREKRFSRLYGTMYFPMPDGELVPRSFEQVKNEYVHGAQSNYADRKVELRFPWWYLNSAGDIDTGFGLTVRIGDKQELADEARRRRGDRWSRDRPNGSPVACSFGSSGAEIGILVTPQQRARAVIVPAAARRLQRSRNSRGMRSERVATRVS